MKQSTILLILLTAVIFGSSGTRAFCQSTAHCTTNTTSELAPNATITINGVTGLTNYYCIGNTISAAVDYTNTDGNVTVTTTHEDCSTDVNSNSCSISLVMTNCTWTASVGSWSTNGYGISASFTPTDCGSGSVSFSVGWTNSCDSSTGSGGASGSFTVVAVSDLAPDLASGQGGLEPGSDPPTYWVCPCPGDVIVTASSCPSLTADQLPDCWTFTGGTEIDKLHHKVKKEDLAKGDVTFTVTCGTSTKTIILRTDKENAIYSALAPSASCLCDNFTDSSPYHDQCGNTLAIDCVGCMCPTIGPLYGHGHFSYRYNGSWVGTCYFPAANNTFLYKTTKHYCRILRTWHLTQQPTSPTIWVVTKYDCLTGVGPLQNCRTSPTWDSAWCRPADETANPGYPANSCENQGTPSSGKCPPYDWQ